MSIDEAIRDYEQMEVAAKALHQELAFSYTSQMVKWLKELKTYREVMIYLFTAEPDGYQLHKWTSEYGYVITVHDVIKAFNRVKEVQND